MSAVSDLLGRTSAPAQNQAASSGRVTAVDSLLGRTSATAPPIPAQPAAPPQDNRSSWQKFLDAAKAIPGNLVTSTENAVHSAAHQSPLQSAKDIIGALTSSERNFTNDALDAIKAPIYQKANDENTARTDALNSQIIKQMQDAESKGDFKKAQALGKILQGSRPAQIDLSKEAPAINKTPAQIAADAAGVALDVGTLGGASVVKAGVKTTAEQAARAAVESGAEQSLKTATQKATVQAVKDIATKSVPQKVAGAAGIGGAYGLDQGVQAGQTDPGELAASTLGGAVAGLGLYGLGAAGSKVFEKLSAAKVSDRPTSDFTKAPKSVVYSPEDLAAKVDQLESHGGTIVESTPVVGDHIGVVLKDSSTGKESPHVFVKSADYKEPALGHDVSTPRAAEQSFVVAVQNHDPVAARDAYNHLPADTQKQYTGAMTQLDHGIGQRSPNQIVFEKASASGDAQGMRQAYDAMSPEEKVTVEGTPALESALGHDVHPPAEGGIQAGREPSPGGSSTEPNYSKLALRTTGEKIEIGRQNIKSAVDAAHEFQNASLKNRELSMRIIRGEHPEVDGISKEAHIAALANEAKSPEKVAELVNSGTMRSASLEATQKGRDIAVLQAIESENAAKTLEGVSRDRINTKYGSEDKFTKKENTLKKSLDESTQKEDLTTADWKEFTDSLPEGQGNQRFIAAVKNGEVDPQAFKNMNPESRQKALEKYFTPAQAEKANVLFERKSLMKSEMRGMMAWVKEAGLQPKMQRDLEATAARLLKALTPDNAQSIKNALIRQRMGVAVSEEEAKVVTTLSQKMAEAKQQYDPVTHTFKTEEAKRQYGTAKATQVVYLNDLKSKEASAITWENFKKNPAKFLFEQSGVGQALQTTLDNSFWGRQGNKAFWNQPKQWAAGFVNSFKVIAKTVFTKSEGSPWWKDPEVGRAIEIQSLSDHFTRPNFLNGSYKEMKINTGIEKGGYAEPIFFKVPVVNRLTKAADNAYNLGGMKLRDDIADAWIRTAKEAGKDVTDRGWLREQGNGINILTGRVSGSNERSFSLLLYSKNFVASNFHFLTAQLFDKEASAAARGSAALRLAKVGTGVFATMVLVSQLPGVTVEQDPRSSNWGKGKIGKYTFDLTGGLGSYITLAARLIPSKDQNGVWGQWSKSAYTQKLTQLNQRNPDGTETFGAVKGTDLVFNFFQGKASPVISAVASLINQSNYDGSPVSIQGVMQNMAIPIGIQNAIQASPDPNKALVALVYALDMFGVNANVQDPTQGKKGSALGQLQATQAFVNGDDAAAQKAIQSSYPQDQWATAYTQAAKAAAAISSRKPDKTTDFYAAYVPVRSAYDKTVAQAKSLVQQNKINEAQRVANDFNATVPGAFKEWQDKYGELSPDAGSLIKGLYVKVGPSQIKNALNPAAIPSF